MVMDRSISEKARLAGTGERSWKQPRKGRSLRARLRQGIQMAFTRLGEHVTPVQLRTLNACINYLETGRWLKAKGFSARPRYSGRELLYAALAERIGGERILYLEFGVWQGASLRVWSRLLQNPLASLHGFDSFQGLPEDWDTTRPKGTFSVQLPPRFDDQRIALHVGLFEDTLPDFILPEHERLVLHLDADLYSSTIYVLRHLGDAIRPGTILIFDEFCDRLHELRAFNEFLDAARMRFAFLGGTRNLEQVAFERLA